MKRFALVCFCFASVFSVSGCSARFAPEQPTEIAIVQQAGQPYRVPYRVIVKPCKPYRLSDFEVNQFSCYVENARFQSMVNPEKMLPESELSDNEPGDKSDDKAQQTETVETQ